MSKFLGIPSWPKMVLNLKKGIEIDLKSIVNHEGEPQKFRAVAQNRAIQIRFQMI